jgi:hypothetical protein
MMTKSQEGARFGKKQTDEEKAAKTLANELADETPGNEQDGLFAPTAQLGPFGSIPSATKAGSSFIDRKDKV